MAKAKKTTASDDAASAPKKAAAPRTKKKAAPAAAPAKAPPSGAPMIDTSMAAASAAKLLAAKARRSEPQMQEVKETGGFKQLKQSLAQPAPAQAAANLGSVLGPAKSNLPFAQHGQKQVGQNQTFGAARVNVPRRTNG